jgi:hypothetical protein
MQHTQPASIRGTSERIDGCVFCLQDEVISLKSLRSASLLAARSNTRRPRIRLASSRCETRSSPRSRGRIRLAQAPVPGADPRSFAPETK